MSSAVGEVLPLAVGVAISPIPIIAVTLMLTTPHARSNATAFLCGWFGGLAVGATAVYLLSSGEGSDDDPATWVRVLQVALGVLAIAIAAGTWQRRKRSRTELPPWLRSLDAIGPTRAATLAILLSLANPKNLVLIVAAATAVAEAETGDATTALAAFVLLGCLGVGVPLALYVVFGERSRRWLERLRAWLAVHDAAVLAVILAAIGAKLIADGL